MRGDLDMALVRTFLTAEDRKFYEHGGLDLIGMGRAMTRDVFALARGLAGRASVSVPWSSRGSEPMAVLKPPLRRLRPGCDQVYGRRLVWTREATTAWRSCTHGDLSAPSRAMSVQPSSH